MSAGCTRWPALVSDESALEACLQRCAIQIDDLLPLPFACHVCAAASSVERPKLSGTLTSFQPRPAMVAHATHPAQSQLAAAVAATGMRALLPLNSNRPVAVPIVR